jgi:hypothetical protein
MLCFVRLWRVPHYGLFTLIVGGFSAVGHGQSTGSTQSIPIPAGVPLHIRVTRTAHLHLGAPVEGQLTEPVYVFDRLILPVGATVHGTVSDTVPAPRKLRIQSLLNGDVTPIRDPVVNFNIVRVGDAEVRLDSKALVRTSQMVSFIAASHRPSWLQQAGKLIRDRIQSAKNAVFAPGKKDRALKLLYSQLPYHPQRIWAGTQFVADLNAPAEVPVASEPVATIASASNVGDVSELDRIDVIARLAADVNSDSATKGDNVVAIVTQPVFNPQHQLLLAEGARLEGVVLQAKPSRSFGRNGQLHFVFRGVQRTDQETQPEMQQIRGTLTGAEGEQAQNISVDEEGAVKSHPDKNRFVAPLVLGLLAAAGHDRDGKESGFGRDTAASNGFGVVARILALTLNNRNVATGFGAYAFAKSVYFRFLTRGHPISFPRDTLVQVELSTRR